MSDQPVNCDVLVVGSGAAGLTTAIVCAHSGLDVLVVEKEQDWGGTTAVSSGGIWAPMNSFATEAGISDSLDAARTYLSETCPDRNVDLTEAFLANVGPALDFLQKNSEAKFFVARKYPDYQPELAGGTQEGRMIWPAPFDGRDLGAEFFTLKPPLRQTMLFGGMIVGVPEMRIFLKAFKSWSAARHTAKRLLGYLRDRLSAPRGYALLNGNALAARLGKSLFDRGISLWLSSPLRDLIVENRKVVGAVVSREGKSVDVRARFGVVLATGGASQSELFRRRFFAHVQRGAEHHTLVPPGPAGDGFFAAERIGAAISSKGAAPVVWIPVSLLPRKDGPALPFPSFIDRAKPGFIAIAPDGRRFTNEANSYHDFVPALIQASQRSGADSAFAWLVASRVAARKYGIGAARPAPFPIELHLRSGYVKRGLDARELARNIGVPEDVLQATLERYNRQAVSGIDEDFGRGSSAYNRYMGDPDSLPNPCVGPLAGELYAIKLHVGDAGTIYGLQVNQWSRVIDGAGVEIPNLYSVGNDVASIFGGGYPGGGSTLGPALAFGYIAGRAIAQEAGRSDLGNGDR